MPRSLGAAKSGNVRSPRRGEYLGGDVMVASELGKGSVFMVRLVLKGFQRPVPAHNILGITRADLGQPTSTDHDSASVSSTIEQSL